MRSRTRQRPILGDTLADEIIAKIDYDFANLVCYRVVPQICQGGEHRAHDDQPGEFPGRYAPSFLALGYCLRQSLAVREERHGQITRRQQ